MYQIDMLGENDSGQLDKFIAHYVDEAEELAEMNVPFFRNLVTHFAEPLDAAEIIRSNLTDGKDISNAPAINVSLMKAAIFEMVFESTDIPVIINEYIEIAKDFTDAKSVRFINAILDKISKHIERRAS
jgi:N utilization substance protein B